MIFQWALRRLLEDWHPTGLAAIDELLVWRNDRATLPKSFSLQLHWN
jgi:hypothetical protein